MLLRGLGLVEVVSRWFGASLLRRVGVLNLRTRDRSVVAVGNGDALLDESDWMLVGIEGTIPRRSCDSDATLRTGRVGPLTYAESAGYDGGLEPGLTVLCPEIHPITAREKVLERLFHGSLYQLFNLTLGHFAEPARHHPHHLLYVPGFCHDNISKQVALLELVDLHTI